jgi:hypothetical protein
MRKFEIKTFYISRYWRSKGIFSVEGKVQQYLDGQWYIEYGDQKLIIGKEAFVTVREAQIDVILKVEKAVEYMRNRISIFHNKILDNQEQIYKLESSIDRLFKQREKAMTVTEVNNGRKI